MFTAFKAVARGESHREKGLPCQDAADTIIKKNGGIIVVSDGHGSEKHFRSGEGSRIAVGIALEAIHFFLQILVKEKKDIHDSINDKQLKQLESYIIIQWRKTVLSHFAENPLNEGELEICTANAIDVQDADCQTAMYGTTLIAAMMQKSAWFAIQIGDGKCVVLNAGKMPYFPPELEDERLGEGRTTSLCDVNAIESFRHVFGYETIHGITVASDGVTDSFIPEKYLKFHTRLYEDFCDNAEKAEKEIQNSISTWSAKGSRDDTSMAGVFNLPETI